MGGRDWDRTLSLTVDDLERLSPKGGITRMPVVSEHRRQRCVWVADAGSTAYRRGQRPCEPLLKEDEDDLE